jgi:HPt (histidine-containing phosphotransfer) domain-containing protein
LKEQFFDDRKLPSVDMACLQELRELTLSNGNPGRFRRLVETFQDALELQLGLMRRALAAGNSDDIADLAHSLKGSAACIGAGYLSSLCSTLEIVSSSTTPDEPKRLLRQIETEAQLVHRILQKEATS